MGIGLGIFGGICVLGIIYLYTQTKDRWNWRKISKRLFVGLGLFFLALFLFIGGLFAYFSIQDYYKAQPKVISSYKGVSIGDKLSDVSFKYKLQKSNEDAKSKNQTYSLADTNLQVQFYDDSTTVDRIIITCNEGSRDEVNGVACWGSSENIFKKYGKENIKVFCKDQPASGNNNEIEQLRSYESSIHGVSYGLYLNKIEAILITKPSKDSSKTSKTWRLCDSEK